MLSLIGDHKRDSLRGVIRNLLEPVNFLNHLWQGKTDDAADIVARFFVNTTIGLGGLIDVAAAKSTILLAHDWGGVIAWTFALRHGEIRQMQPELLSREPRGRGWAWKCWIPFTKNGEKHQVMVPEETIPQWALQSIRAFKSLNTPRSLSPSSACCL